MHTLAWVAWVTMVMAVALTTTNPYYLGIVLLAVILVAVLAPKTAVAITGLRALAIFGAMLFAISLGIATINGNAGSHVLFTMPGPDVPDWLGGLRLGGPVTAEGLVAAAVRGLAILCVFLAFATFNGAVSPHRVLRTAPAALFHAGLVVTVGLTLLPATIEDLHRLREMRALRGAPAGLRDLPALVVPAVLGGLERAMRLAEAMEARGYASDPQPARWQRLSALCAAPLLLAAAWGWYYFEPARPFAGAAALLGVSVAGSWVWSASRARRTTRLDAERFSAGDRAAVAGSLAIALVSVAGGAAAWWGLRYNPFAGFHLPSFSLLGALLALAAAWPAPRLAFERKPARASSPESALAAEGAIS